MNIDRTLYVDRVGAFAFDRLSCLRNEYAKNECSLCLEQCAQSAFVFRDGKLRLDARSCTQCGACIGACPTGALSLYGFSYDGVLEKLKRGETHLTCKQTLPCLGALSVTSLSALLIESAQSFTCHLLECETCPVNAQNVVKETIVQRLEEANAFVAALGYTCSIFVSQEPVKESSRRAFFERFKAAKEPQSEAPSEPLGVLKRALKASLNASTLLEKPFSFIHPHTINQACDNCKECVQFCPSNALSYNGDQTKILFQLGKCVGCGICEDICKKEAIHTPKNSFDVVSFAYDRAEVLIEHDLQVCLTCKCAFSYKGGEKICERCASFEIEHASLFTLASQSE